MKIAEYQQMMDYLTGPRERFSNGNKVTGKFKIDPKASKDKQVLVQEGIYFKPKSGKFKVQLPRGDGINKSVDSLAEAKKTLAAFEEKFPKKISQIANPPKGSEKFLKSWMAERGVSKWGDLTRNQKSNFNRKVWPSVQKESKLIANKIPASEMAELLGIDKSVLDNSRKRGGIFAKEIERVLGKPVNLVGKAGGTLGERGEYIYYDKPTSAQIKSLKTYIPKTFGQLTQDVTNRVKTLAGDTEFMSDLKKIKTVDDVDKLKMLQKYTNRYPELNLTSSKLARSTLLISQVAGGYAEYRGLNNIKGDKVLSRRLNNMIENAPFGNVHKKEAYDLAMSNIDQQFGSETATFSKYKQKIKSEFNRLGFKNFQKFNLDEYVGTSIGGFKDAGQYSVFSRLLAADVNQKSGASYLGRLSQATDKLEDALAVNNKKLANEIVENNMADALKTSKKTKNSLPYLSLESPGSKKNFGIKRLNQLEAQGLDFKKFYKERGFGFSGLKGAMTQKEIISRLEGTETGFLKGKNIEIAQRLALLGCPGKAKGGRIGFQEGTVPSTQCVRAGAEIVNKGKFDKLSPGQRANLTQFLNRAYGIGRAVMKFGVIPEAIFAAGFSLVGMGQGQSFSEAFLRSIDYLFPGNQTKMADQKKFESTVGPENAMTIMRAKDYRDAQQKLNDAVSNLETNQAVLDESEFGYTANINSRDQLETDKQFIKAAEQNLKNKFQPEAVTDSASRLEMEAEDIAGTNNIFKKIAVAARNSKQDEIENLMAPEKQQQGTALPMLTNKDLADFFITDEFLQQEKDERFDGIAPELTKENVLNFYRSMKPEELKGQDNTLNQVYFQTVFDDARRNSANQERFFGTQGDFFGGTVTGRKTPTNRFSDFKLGMYAGGGIAKLAGKSSGPAPEKGPTPQGLDFLIKRGR